MIVVGTNNTITITMTTVVLVNSVCDGAAGEEEIWAACVEHWCCLEFSQVSEVIFTPSIVRGIREFLLIHEVS